MSVSDVFDSDMVRCRVNVANGAPLYAKAGPEIHPCDGVPGAVETWVVVFDRVSPSDSKSYDTFNITVGVVCLAVAS